MTILIFVERVVSFVPPDGNFELMKYRVHSNGHVSAPCYCQPLVSFEYANDRGSITVTIGVKQTCSLLFPQAKKPLIVVGHSFIILNMQPLQSSLI